jgi:hypothetical protein
VFLTVTVFLFQRRVGQTDRFTNPLYGLAAFGEDQFVSFEDRLNYMVFFQARSKEFRTIRELTLEAKEVRRTTAADARSCSSIRTVAVDNFGPENEPRRIALCDWGEPCFDLPKHKPNDKVHV